MEKITRGMVASVCAALLVVAAGCDKDKSRDADADPELDVSGDVGVDTPSDVPPDMTTDTSADPSTDATPDGTPDADEDAATDGPDDVPADAPADAPLDGDTTCACADTGVTLVVVSGCVDWPDATECTGWHSVVDPDGDGSPDSAAPYPHGTEFCAFDCCIRIVCP